MIKIGVFTEVIAKLIQRYKFLDHSVLDVRTLLHPVIKLLQLKKLPPHLSAAMYNCLSCKFVSRSTAVVSTTRKLHNMTKPNAGLENGFENPTF